jgi:hypothetical protein
MPRPTKLTPEVHATIVKNIGNGATFVDASGAVGIDYASFNNWMKRGETEKKGIYFEFFQACKAAQASARLKFTLVISKAASEGDWRAALEYLKRHDPENWGDKSSVDVKAEVSVKTWADFIKGQNDDANNT